MQSVDGVPGFLRRATVDLDKEDNIEKKMKKIKKINSDEEE